MQFTDAQQRILTNIGGKTDSPVIVKLTGQYEEHAQRRERTR